MTTAQALIAFLIAASILTVTPGVDTVLVLRSAASGGRRAGTFAAAGIAMGCLAWGAMVSIGLGALLAASEFAFTVLKWAGAAYLLYLGVRLIWHPHAGPDLSGAAPANALPWQALKQGLLTNLLNPKVGIFYVTLLPQFIPADVNVSAFSLLLASIHVVLGLAWFAALIAATVPIGRYLRRPGVNAALNRLTGGVFVMFGAKLALSR